MTPWRTGFGAPTDGQTNGVYWSESQCYRGFVLFLNGV